ncbi:MAG: hypothetical protein ABL879_19145, partial [Devosia sp.]
LSYLIIHDSFLRCVLILDRGIPYLVKNEKQLLKEEIYDLFVHHSPTMKHLRYWNELIIYYKMKAMMDKEFSIIFFKMHIQRIPTKELCMGFLQGT